jgi:pyrroloquinoline quinone biosynthesis protein B
MIIKVLGSAAGGGFPQWNCNCHNCVAVRAGTPGFRARTQSSLAVSRNGVDWALLNASPDLRQQINDTPALHADPKVGLRHSPIKAAVLTTGDVDHIVGLINLREAQPFSIYATSRVLDTIRSNSVFQVLAAPLVPRVEIELDKPFALKGAGVDLGLTVEAFAVPGKVALYLEDKSSGDFGTQEGDTIGLKVSDPAAKKSFFYIPGCASIDARLAARLQGASIVFFDGTLFTDNEMI